MLPSKVLHERSLRQTKKMNSQRRVILWEFRNLKYPDFRFQIFVPKELSIFSLATLGSGKAPAPSFLPESPRTMCFMSGIARVSPRLRELCCCPLLWEGPTPPLIGIIGEPNKGSAHSNSKIYSLMGCNSHYVLLITLGRQ